MKIEPLADFLLALFITCICRQYLWAVGGTPLSDGIAWALSILISCIIVRFLAGGRSLNDDHAVNEGLSRSFFLAAHSPF